MSMHQKEYLVTVHAVGDVVVLHTLHWADEVRDPQETLDNLPSGSRSTAEERKMARELIDAMVMDWDPHDHTNRTQERVQELVEAKQAGGTVEKSGPAPGPANVVDLTTALRESVGKARKGGRGRKQPRARRSGAGSSRAGPSGAGRSGDARSGTGRSGKSGRSREKERPAKAELYRQAADADIPGRSSMTRDELERALRRSASTRKAAS